eukprot:m.611928 g.611928  ORF g.611928 m.611928 type:complete len:940 (+) comp58142_c0_seq2:181-3000(+)
MADLSMLNYEDSNYDEDDTEEGADNEYQNSSPMQQLINAAESNIVSSRDIAAAELVNVLLIQESFETAKLIIPSTVRLLNDVEPPIRSRSVDQVFEISTRMCALGEEGAAAVVTQLLPAVARLLQDSYEPVRISSRSIFTTLLAREVIRPAALAPILDPAVQLLASNEKSDELRSDALSLIQDTAAFMDQDFCREKYLPIVVQLASDPGFRVRKACASCVVSVGRGTGSETLLAHLIPVFEMLLGDDIWGVRKACAECIAQLSELVPPQLRLDRITGWFLALAKDPSRWVRGAAYRSLGQLIATYGTPLPADGVLFDDVEEDRYELVLHGGASILAPVSPPQLQAPQPPQPPPPAPKPVPSVDLWSSEQERDSKHTADMDVEPPPPSRGLDSVFRKSEQDLQEVLALFSLDDTGDSSTSGLSQQPWGQNLMPFGDDDDDADEPDELDLLMPSKQSSLFLSGFTKPSDEPPPPQPAVSESETDSDSHADAEESSVRPPPTLQLAPATETSTDEPLPKSPAKDVHTITLMNPLYDSSFDGASEEGTATRTASDGLRSEPTLPLHAEREQPREHDHLPARELRPPAAQRPQSQPFSDLSNAIEFESRLIQAPIVMPVPESLIRLYEFMIDETSAKEIDNEITRMCAFSLPAVAWTIGRRHWPRIRQIFIALSASDDWKIRATLAQSIHVLAQVLGRRITEQDLLTNFNGFVKDWDEVRLGALKHLSDFLKVLSPHTRRTYLAHLETFKEADESRNWRFRRLLARQLSLLPSLFHSDDVDGFMTQQALNLAQDPIAYVCQPAHQAVTEILKSFLDKGSERHAEAITIQICALAEQPKATSRQCFAQICWRLPACVPAPYFASQFLRPLVALRSDTIANVRLSAARAMSQAAHPAYFDGLPAAVALVTSALEDLAHDMDVDVVYMAKLQPGALSPPAFDDIADR